MSRQILSYADLGPITSVTTPIPGPSSPLPRPQPPHHDDDGEGEPPRKRLRTNDEEEQDDSLAIKNGNNPTTVHVNGNKRKKVQRQGNPSGVPWTRHWDAQPFSGGNAGQGLVYEEGDTTVSSSRNNNESSSKTMPPPPPPSFIGPVAPSSNAQGKGKGRRKGKNGRANKTKEVISLANEEEWDDSALIDAWNAAEEEYREMNGGRKWRCEPVKHSSLWHDAFHEDDDTDDEPSDNAAAVDDDDGDLQDTLGVTEEAVVQGGYELDETEAGLGHAGTGTNTSGTLGSFGHALGTHLPRLDAPPAFFGIGATRSAIMEEAFRRAQEASYTAGYWTAVYQMHASQQDPPRAKSPGVVDRDEESVKEEEEEEEGVFLPAQR